jgi:hypothetical protein
MYILCPYIYIFRFVCVLVCSLIQSDSKPPPAVQQHLQQLASVDINSIAASVAQLHGVPVHTATFDHCHETWLSERASPSGVVLLEGDTSGKYLAHAAPTADSSAAAAAEPASPSSQSSVSAESEPNDQYVPAPIILLHYTCGAKSHMHSCHVQPLIPASNYMLTGPQHPCFTMQPTLWVPMKVDLMKRCTFFLTPYHRGYFDTGDLLQRTIDSRVLDASHGSAVEELMFPCSGSTDSSFAGAIHVGSVVAFREYDSQGALLPQEQQGIVVLTFVRHSASLAAQWRHELRDRGFQRSNPLYQLFTRPTPIASCVVVKLLAPGAATLPD